MVAERSRHSRRTAIKDESLPGIVISLFDHSGIAVKDWARMGYRCFCFDKLHSTHPRTEVVGNGSVTFLQADLNPKAWGWALVQVIVDLYATGKRILFAWPPCDDLTSSGAKHFKKKAQVDPLFQKKAVQRATRSAAFARKNGFMWLVENPVGRLCTLWRKPDKIWHPHQFGGLLPDDDQHPKWPQYIAPRDAYTKTTGAWFGNGFVFPATRSVEPEILERITASGRTIRGSRQFMKLGGSSAKTKEIRNMTPRGAALAFCLANA